MISKERREIRRKAFEEWDAMQSFFRKRTARAVSRHTATERIHEEHKRAVAKFLRGRD